MICDVCKGEFNKLWGFAKRTSEVNDFLKEKGFTSTNGPLLGLACKECIKELKKED